MGAQVPRRLTTRIRFRVRPVHTEMGTGTLNWYDSFPCDLRKPPSWSSAVEVRYNFGTIRQEKREVGS